MVKMLVSIDGMSCSMCEARVNEIIRSEFPEISKVKSSYRKKTTVIVTDQEIPLEELKAALDPMGYIVTATTAEPFDRKNFLLFGRNR